MKNICSRSIASMQTVLSQSRASLGKVTKPYHFSNEIRLVNFALHGYDKHGLELNSLSRDQLRILRRVICSNARMIKAHVDYKQRKQACRQLVLNQATKSPT